mgnify:CR=1 FL=1
MDTPVLVMRDGQTEDVPSEPQVVIEPEVAKITPIKHPVDKYVRPVQVANIEGKRRYNRHRDW